MDSATFAEIFSEDEWRALANGLSLSPRQGEIIRLLLKGYSDKQVAMELDIAIPTVRTHLSRLFLKFSLQDRNELILHIFGHFRKGCHTNGDWNGCPGWLSRNA